MGGPEEQRVCPHERMAAVKEDKEAFKGVIYFCPGK